MTDPFADLKHEVDKAPVPPGNALAAVRRGRRLKRRRIAAAAAMMSLLSVGGVAMARYGLPFPERTESAKRIEGPQVSAMMRAKVATFSFHALKDIVGYRYDYTGLARLPNAWITSYVDGIEGVTEQGDPNQITLRIEQVAGNFVITEVTGLFSERQRAALLAFSERVPSETFGWEFFDIKVRRGLGDRLRIEVRMFYIGPIPTGQRSRCDFKLMDERGRVAYRAVRGTVLDPEPAEESRDGGAIGWELAPLIEGDTPPWKLDHSSRCTPVEGSWHAEGEARLVTVRPGDRADYSGFPLDAQKHVLVVTKIEFRGEMTGAETICVATVYDAEGDPIDSHGQTIYGPLRKRDLKTRGATQEIAIPVDVGDPDSAASGRVRCQPTIPGVPLGPDQEEGPS